MKTHARVVVIGGGVVGVSTLYHLALKGWSDVVLLERAELTAGSTWHAAGLLPLFNMSYTVGQLHKYSVDLYKRLPAETGQDVSFHVTGNLRLATCRDRMDEYQKYCGTANTIGVPFKVISPAEVAEALAADRPRQRRGHAEDRRRAVSPRRRAHRARGSHHGAAQGGAKSRRRNLRADRSDGRQTQRFGRVACHAPTRATSSPSTWSARPATMRGRPGGCSASTCPRFRSSINTSCTTSRPELKAYRQSGGRELAVLRESDKSYYLREERMGWILGPYEAGAPARFADGVPDWFGKSLFEGDLERLLPHVEAAQRRVPSLATCGIKDIVNGPIAYTPDGSPLIGPAWGVTNLWLNEGHSFGITAAGGSGWQLAEWIVEGEPGIDMMAVDPRRYGPYTSKRYVVQKNEETYRNVFVIHYPG